MSQLVAALLGAFGGALTATRFAARQEELRLSLDEFRKVNTAVKLASANFNAAFTFKAQITHDIVTQFEEGRNRFIQQLAAASAGQLQGQIEVHFELQKLPSLRLEVDELQRIVFSEIDVDGRVTMAAALLAQSFHELAGLIERHQIAVDQISEMSRGSSYSVDEIAHHYFGIMQKSGVIDERLSGAIEGIKQMNDNVIFFSMFIAQNLSEHARRLKRSLPPGAGSAAKFALAERADKTLLPDPSEFEDLVQ